MTEITKDALYVGLRISFTADVAGVHCDMKVDIGFSDEIYPAALMLDYPATLNGIPGARLLCYSLESVVAEKWQAMVQLKQMIVERLKNKEVEVIIPPLWCTTDNAAMIAKAGYEYFKKGVVAGLDIGVDPTWELEDCILRKDYELTYIEENELIEYGINYENFFYLDNLVSMIDTRIDLLDGVKKERLTILKNQIVDRNKK